MLDCIIIGAGPAGLSAALILGRCRRRVVICDAGKPRNRMSNALHGFLTRDGADPSELLSIAREQLTPYETVELLNISAIDAQNTGEGFEVTLADGSTLTSRKLLLATGVVDRLPDIDGFDRFYGRSVWHCPYCDGWEMRDLPLAVYGKGEHGKGLALELTVWSKDLVLVTDGPSELNDEDLERLSRNQIKVREEEIARLEGEDGALERIVFKNGESILRRGMFFSTGNEQGCNLPAQFGCDFTEKGAVKTGEYEATNIPGLYVAGDASRAVQLVIVAAAEGAQAAFAINTALLKEDLL
ncbi:MAG TPA: NAD(P)/FAD-dependent oxidoreductase [Blastocatellia bacterium]|nr:NAD(P)/FAD-dependent oxidoreductase [Blastocatellia bacterium]